MKEKVPEFEKYIYTLSLQLTMDKNINHDICKEILQSMYDKYNEYLIRGYGMKESTVYTLNTYESPEALAHTFNNLYKKKQQNHYYKSVFSNRKLLFAHVLIIITLTMLLGIGVCFAKW